MLRFCVFFLSSCFSPAPPSTMTMDQTPTFVHVNPNFLNDGYSAAAAYNSGHHRMPDHHHHHHPHEPDHHEGPPMRGHGHGHGFVRSGGYRGPRGGGGGDGDDDHSMRGMQMSDARRMRKTIFRRTIDYNTPVMTYLEDRVYRRILQERRWIQPDYLYQVSKVVF